MGFTFKQFHIVDNHTAMKVGTDGVLLGAWAQGGKKILDIGTGTGLIALMMAQRFPLAAIDAIEIDKGAFEDAQLNVSQSPFNDRINIVNCCLQDYQLCHKTCTEGVYDAIVCNPPYFICLIEFGKDATKQYEEEEQVLTTDEGTRTEWYQNITQEFYIK